MFRQRFPKVAEYWCDPKGKQTLQYELRETGLTLFPSPLLLPPERGESRLTTASGGDAARAYGERDGREGKRR